MNERITGMKNIWKLRGKQEVVTTLASLEFEMKSSD